MPRQDYDDLDPSLTLPDARHEMFAYFLSQGYSQVRAYEAAGYVPTGSNANVLANKPHIRARVAFLVEQNKESHTEASMRMGTLVVDLDRADENAKRLTPEWFLFELAQTMKDAREAGKFGDAITALKVGAEWLGFFQETKTKPKNNKGGEDGAAIEDVGGRPRIAVGDEEALQGFAGLFAGDRAEDPAPVEDGASELAGDDGPGTDPDLAEQGPGELVEGRPGRSRADRKRVSR